MRLHIHDRDQSPQGFGLLKLLGVIVGDIGEAASTWRITRSVGYGLEVKAMEERLDTTDGVEVSVEELAFILPGLHQWFFDFDAICGDRSVRFALCDSSFMLVDAPASTIATVQRSFGKTTIVESR